MFNTLKSKIIFLTISILFVLSLIFTCFTFLNFKKDKTLIIEGCNFTITTLAEKINKEITSNENSAHNLAVMGEIFYNTNKNPDMLGYAVSETFIKNNYSIGGGVWFEPYVVNPSLKNYNKFAYKDKSKKVIIDYNPYNYLTQNWYNEIKKQIMNAYDVKWSTPYYESQGSETLMVTAGSGIYDNKDNFVGISTVDWEINSIVKTITQMRPTPNSFTLFADKKNDFVIVSTYENLPSQFGDSLKEIPWYNDQIRDKQTFSYKGTKYISYVKTLDNGMILIVNVPQNELFLRITKYLLIMLGLLFISSICIAIATFLILKRNINTPIEKLTDIANKISSGNLDTEIKLTKPKEFADLANTFNNMTQDIKRYLFNLNKITQEKELIESELSIAREIQYSALPDDFYKDRKEFEIIASMKTSKAVGGDFYDFFFINPNKFMFLIADVSGKGVPAALFMMTTKTLIKNVSEQGFSEEELFGEINEKICINNKQGFFVTLFAGIIDLVTGKITFINCGHNPPLIKRNNGNYEYLGLTPNLVLGAMSDVKYDIMKTNFNVGDTLFMYTDGITEAINSEGEFYGEKRLKDCLGTLVDKSLCDTMNGVKENIASFIGNTEQSDDITVMIFKYNGTEQKEFKIKATIQNYNIFDKWLENNYNALSISEADKNKIKLSAEEIYTNIASYAYPDKEGDVTVTFDVKDNNIIIKFIDDGIAYNPLDKQEPNIDLDVEDRQIGGLGIFMVKQSMDSVEYEYVNNQNILTIRLAIE